MKTLNLKSKKLEMLLTEIKCWITKISTMKKNKAK